MKTKFSLILALLLCISLASPALAAEPAGGTCGDNLTWSLGADGTLTVSGTGEMDDYDYNVDEDLLSTPWAAQREEITSVVIEKGVASIGRWAFYDCGNLTSATIPDGVATIGENAFRECIRLTDITIPDSITVIKESVFHACSSLSRVTIPGSVTTIEAAAFLDCNSLACVIIPDSVTRIGIYAFYCEGLEDIYYSGNGSQWAQIDINSRYNAPLFRAAIHYNSAGPAPSGVVSVIAGGETVEWTDAAPFIDGNNRTMVPLRAVADAMGLAVNWDASAREAGFTDGSKTIIFPIASTTARTSGGGTVTMDTAAIIRDGRTYAPIRYLAEYFGYTAAWDAASRTVTIG